MADWVKIFWAALSISGVPVRYPIESAKGRAPGAAIHGRKFAIQAARAETRFCALLERTLTTPQKKEKDETASGNRNRTAGLRCN
jgi:hypothetical protein